MRPATLNLLRSAAGGSGTVGRGADRVPFHLRRALGFHGARPHRGLPVRRRRLFDEIDPPAHDRVHVVGEHDRRVGWKYVRPGAVWSEPSKRCASPTRRSPELRNPDRRRAPHTCRCTSAGLEASPNCNEGIEAGLKIASNSGLRAIDRQPARVSRAVSERGQELMDRGHAPGELPGVGGPENVAEDKERAHPENSNPLRNAQSMHRVRAVSRACQQEHALHPGFPAEVLAKAG